MGKSLSQTDIRTLAVTLRHSKCDLVLVPQSSSIRKVVPITMTFPPFRLNSCEQKLMDLPEDIPENLEKKAKALARGRGKDTLFRVTIRNQADLIAIADNKANMIISVNTIIVSLIIAGLGSGMSFGPLNLLQFPQIIVPLTILLIGCTSSAIFSIFAAKPRFLKSKVANYSDGSDEEWRSILFFGNYRHLSLPEYMEKIHDLLSTNDGIYRNLIIDMYFNGQVLHRKYRLLSFSYTSFLIGLVLCVIIYLILSQIF